jgi:uncharacterized membrane protein YkvA (DUF1232 family)
MANDVPALLDKLKARARALKTEVYAITIAARDPRTPWYAKALIFLIVAYALSPIDLIPDFVPILGYLDDLLIVPGGIWLAIRLIPPEVLEESRATAGTYSIDKRVRLLGAAIIILIWILALLWIASIVFHYRELL